MGIPGQKVACGLERKMLAGLRSWWIMGWYGGVLGGGGGEVGRRPFWRMQRAEERASKIAQSMRLGISLGGGRFLVSLFVLLFEGEEEKGWEGLTC